MNIFYCHQEITTVLISKILVHQEMNGILLQNSIYAYMKHVKVNKSMQ